MSRYVFKLPDLGEGTVEAEIVAGGSSRGMRCRKTTCSRR
jgi:hypothetical protein